MLTASAARSRKTQKHYATAKRPDGCDFCLFNSQHSQVIEEHQYFWLVHNLFPYDVWDSLPVLDHRMLIPKAHIKSVGELPPEGMVEFAKLLAEGEAHGYSVYSRAPSNVSKSMAHQHTHLLKLGDKPKSLQLHIRKPYIFVSV